MCKDIVGKRGKQNSDMQKSHRATEKAVSLYHDYLPLLVKHRLTPELSRASMRYLA